MSCGLVCDSRVVSINAICASPVAYPASCQVLPEVEVATGDHGTVSIEEETEIDELLWAGGLETGVQQECRQTHKHACVMSAGCSPPSGN